MTATARSKRTFTVGSVVLATLLGFASTSPVLDSIVYDAAPHTCAPHKCSSDAGALIETYNVGKIYEYDYLVDSITEMKSASPSKQSTLNMVARVKVQVLTPCEFSVKVTNVVMNGKTGSMNEELSKYPSEFVLENRQVQRVCSHPQEPEWVTNIKKGVISSFQSTILPEGSSLGFNVTETDVVGICETEYMPTRAKDEYQTYQKIKHMDTCRHNQELFQFALNLPDMNVQNLPLMRSEHACQVTVFGDGRLESSDCEEIHVFQPFSSASSGAIAEVRRQVKFAGESTPASVTTRLVETRESSLIFTHPDQKEKASNEQAKLVLALLNTFKTADESAKPEMFSQLVHSMRRLSHSQLLNIFYNGITESDMRILALDAIPLLKTDAGIALMKDIIESGELPRQTLDMWFATLPYYKNPTRGMLDIVSNFIRGEQPLNSALLGVSSLVSSYCSANPDCHDLPEVQAIITQYEQLLGSQCAVIDRAEEDKVVLALKALRTIGHLRRGQAVVEKCYTDSTNSMFIRLAAIDTINQLNCGHDEYDFKRQLFATFSDNAADSELRIGAYLALMNCPTQSMVNLVKNVLVNEPVNQVGSFVWTHLTNLQESQSLSHHKQTLKTLVGRDFLQNKWRTDVRKFSRYFESSYYAKDLNVGATTDGQIVFSQDSYIPRSGMLNLTANVFGENLHLLEIGSRVEGFEGIVEDLFGPDGYFREDSLHKLLQSLRQKRSNEDVSGKISDFQQTFNQDITDAHPRGNMYMRMFGRDLHYASFEGLDNLMATFTPASLFSSSTPDLDFSRSSIFLDGKIVVPTLAGLPLDLDVNGTSAISLKSKNKFDLVNLLRSGDANLEVKLYPTATLQISATMTLDAKYAKAGLKSLSKLHTSTYLDGEARMEGGKLMKARLNVPKKTMDILDVSVDFLSINEQGLYEPLISQNEAVDYVGCTPDSLNHVLGMKLCGSALYHNNPQDQLDLAFAGPFKMKLGLEKIDTFDKYTFEYKRVIPANPSESMTKMSAIWDTPGSSINRLSKINLVVDESTLNFVKVDIEIPVRQIKINALYRWTDADKMIKASIAMENELLLVLRQSIKRSAEGKYDAIIRAAYKKIDIINWTGTLIATDKKMDVKTNLNSHYLARAIAAGGSLVKTDENWDIDGHIKSHWINVDVKGLFTQTDTSFDFKSDLTYSGQGYDQTIKVQSAYQLTKAGTMETHNMNVQFNLSNYPKWNTALKWKLVHSDSYLENEIKVKFGPHTYEVQQLFSSQASSVDQELLFTLGLNAPDRGISYKMALEHRHKVNENTNRIELMFPGLLEFETHVNYKLDTTTNKRKLDAGLSYGETALESAIEMIVTEAGNGIDGQAFLRWGQPNDPNANINADFKLGKRNPTAVDYVLEANLITPWASPMKATGTFKYQPGVSALLEVMANHGQDQITTSLEVEKIATGGKMKVVFKTTQLNYNINVVLKNDNTKSLHAVLNLDKKYELNAVAKGFFRDILFDLSYGPQPADRIVFSSQLAPNKLTAKLKMLGHEGKMMGEYQALPGDYFLKIDIQSTIKAVKTVKLNMEHKLKEEGKMTVASMAQLVWNGEEHLIKISVEKGTNAWIQAETKSAYTALDKLFMRLETARVEKRQTTNILLKYKTDALKMTTLLDTGKPKEGLVTIETPWEKVRQMTVGFLFNYGQEVQLDTYLTWNQQQVATANVTGHIKASDLKLDFHVTKTGLGEAKAGLAYKKSTSLGMIGSTYLGFGENIIKMNADFKPNPVVANFKLDIKTTPIKANTEFAIKYLNDGTLEVKSHLDVANTRRAELIWSSIFNSIMDHEMTARLNISPYTVGLDARNDNLMSPFYKMFVKKGQQEVSRIHLKGADVHTKKEARKEVSVAITWGDHVSKVIVSHTTTVEKKYISFIRIQSQEKIFELKHDTKLTGDLHFISKINLETPFDYVRKASTLIDVDIKPSELKAMATATFNEETLSIKTDGTITLDNYRVKEVNLNAILDGFLGKMMATVNFKKFAGKGIFATGTVKLPSTTPLKLTVSFNELAQGATFAVEVDAGLPYKLEGFYSRNADLTHFEEMLALTTGQDVVFNATSEMEIQSWTDISITGILDMALLERHVSGLENPIEFSALLKKGEDSVVSELAIKNLFMLNAKTEWSGKKAMINTILKWRQNAYAVLAKGEMSGSLKKVEVSLTKNAKVWKAEALVTHDTVHMDIKAQLTFPEHQQNFEAMADLTAQTITAMYVLNDKKVELSGKFICTSPRLCTMETKLENNVYFTALKTIEIEGKLDATNSEHATVSLTASANDDHHFKLMGNLKETTGDLSVSLNLPIKKITDFSAKAHYEILNKEGRATLTVGTIKKVDFSWKIEETEVRAHLITPFTSVREVSVLGKKTTGSTGIKTVHLEIDVNTERIVGFEGKLGPRTFAVKLTSKYPNWRNVEIAFNLNTITDFHLAAVYNDILEIRLKGLLTERTGEFNAILKTPLHMGHLGYIASVEIFRDAKVKTITMNVHSNQWRAGLAGLIKGKEASLSIQKNDDTLFATEMTLTGIETYKGAAEMITTAVFLTHPITVKANFDLATENKKIDITEMSAAGRKASALLTFKMTHDTFDGVMKCKSDMAGYEAATIKARYNIATEPTAKLEIERNGKVNFIETKLKFGNVIPTVEITTSFPKFKKMIFKGNYKANDKNHKQLDLALSRNDENIFVFALTSKIHPTYKDGDFVLTLLTPITNWKTLGMELGWKSQRDPYGLKIKLTKGQDEISFTGKVAVNEGEFSLKLVTPFQGFESIGLSGKLGTTSLGKHMGVSFDNNSVKRDVSFAYDFDEDNTAIVNIQTPLEQFKSIKIRSMMMADMGSQMDFSFEAEGKEDFGAGLKWDFSRGLANGELLIKTINKDAGIDLETKLEYSNVDGIMSNGFDGMFFLSWKGNQQVYVKAKRVPGHTELVIKTPIFKGFENMKVELKSDYVTKATATAELGRLGVYNVALNKVDNGYKMEVKTPFSGYDKLKAEIKSDYATMASAAVELGTLGVYSVALNKAANAYNLEVKTPFSGYEHLKADLVIKNDGKIISLKATRGSTHVGTVTLDVNPSMESPRFLIKIEVPLIELKWAELSMKYKDGKADLYWKSPAKKGDISFEYKKAGLTHTAHLKADVHGKKADIKLDYTGERLVGDHAVVFFADVVGKKADIKIGYKNEGPAHTIYFNAVVVGMKADITLVFKNEKPSFAITINADVVGKKAEIKLDYKTEGMADPSPLIRKSNAKHAINFNAVVLYYKADIELVFKNKIEPTTVAYSVNCNAFVAGKKANKASIELAYQGEETAHTITVNADVNLEKKWENGNGKVNIKLGYKKEGPAHTINLNADVYGKKAEIKLVFKKEGIASIVNFNADVAGKKADIKLVYKKDTAIDSYLLDAKTNGNQKVYYFYESVWNQGHLSIKNEFESNVEKAVFLLNAVKLTSAPVLVGLKHTGKLDLKYSMDMSSPWQFDYTESQGTTEINMAKILFVNQGGKKFKFTGHIKSPAYLTEDITGEATLEITENPIKSVKMNLKYKTTQVGLEIKHLPTSFVIDFTSNIPTFEKIIAETKWIHDDKKIRCELQLKQNAKVLLDSKIAVDFNPFTRFHFLIKLDKQESQEFVITWNNFVNAEGIVTFEAKGKLNLKSTGKLRTGKLDDLLELDIQGNNPYKFSYGIKFAIKHSDGAYGITGELSAKNNVYKFTIDLVDLDLHNYKGKLTVNWDLPKVRFVSKFLMVCNLDVPAQKISTVVDVNGQRKIELNGEGYWSVASAKFVLVAVANGKDKIELVAKRESYKNINLSLDVLGGKITYANTNVIHSEKDFDIKAKLTVSGKLGKMLNIGKYERIIGLDLKSKPTMTKVYPATLKSLIVIGKLTLNQRSYNLDYKHQNNAQNQFEQFKLSLTPSQGPNKLIIEYKNKDDGKVLTLQVKDKTLKIFENLTKHGQPIKITMTENIRNTQLTFNLDKVQKSFSLTAQKGPQKVMIKGEAKDVIKFEFNENIKNTKLTFNLDTVQKALVLTAGMGQKSVEIKFNLDTVQKSFVLTIVQGEYKIEARGEAKGVIKFEFKENIKNTKLTFNLDTVQKALVLTAGMGPKTIEINFNLDTVQKSFVLAIVQGGYKIEAKGEAKDVIIFVFNENIKNTKLTFNLDIVQKSFALTIAPGGKSIVAKGEAKDVLKFEFNENIKNTKFNFILDKAQKSLKLQAAKGPKSIDIKGDAKDAITFIMKETFMDTNLNLNLNIQQKQFMLKAGKGARFVQLTGKATATNNNNYYILFKGATEAGELFEIKGTAIYPVQWKVEVTFKKTTKLTLDVTGKQDLTECTSSFEIVRNARKELTMKLKMVNKDAEKSVNADFKYLAKNLKLETKFVPGDFEFKLTSTLPKLKKIELEVEYEENKFSTELEYEELKFQVDYEHKNGVWTFDAKAPTDNFVKAKFDIRAKTLTFNSKIAGKKFDLDLTYSPTSLKVEAKALQGNFIKTEIDANAGILKFKGKIAGKQGDLDVAYSGNDLKIEVTEPFTDAGKIKLTGNWEKRSDGVSLKASGNVNGVDYKFSGSVGFEGQMSISVTRGPSDEFKTEINVANSAVGKSLTILVAGSQIQTYKVSVKYTLADKVFTTRIHAQIPPYSNNIDTNVEVGYDFPKKMTFKTKFSHNGDVLIDLDTGIAIAQDYSDIRSTFLFASPPLGVPKVVGLKVVYRLVSATDFDLKADVMTPAHTFKAGAKLQLGEAKLDAQLQFAYGQKEFHMKFGGSLISTGDRVDIKRQTFKAYVNKFMVEFSWDEPRFGYTSQDLKYALKFVGERNAEYDMIYKLVGCDQCFDVVNIDFVVELFPDYVPKSLTFDAQAKNDLHFRVVAQYDKQKMMGGYFFKNAKLQKSAQITLEHGKEGGVEIIIGGLEKHKMTLEWPTAQSRVTRAIFDSSSYGRYEFLADQDINSAIIVLTTGHGIHKFSYQIHNEDKFELTVTLESPLLTKGHATFHLLLDPTTKTYNVRVTLNEEHFASLSLVLDLKDIQASLSLQSPLLPCKIEGQVKLKNTPQLVSCELSFLWKNQKHTMQFIIKKVETSLTFVARSPLLLGNEWSVQGSFVSATEGTHKFTAVANIANEKIQLQGKINHRSLTDFGGNLVYQGTSSILAKANVDFKVQLDLQRKSLIKLDVTSTHPALPKVKLMLSLDGTTNGYQGNFVGILPKLDKIEASFTLNEKSLMANSIKVTVSTLKHRISTEANWNWAEGIINGVVLGPKAADKWVFKTQITSDSLVMTVETTRPGMDRIELVVRFDPMTEAGACAGQGNFVMKIPGKELNGELMYKMDTTGSLLMASLNTPFQHHETYELQLGYEDSQKQKVAKAHFTTPSGQTGFLVEFFANTLQDFLFLVEIDLPIPELQITKIQLGHSLTDEKHSFELGAEMNNFLFTIDYELKANMLDIDASFNTYKLDLLTYFNLDEKKFDTVLKTSTPWGSLDIPLTVDTSVQKLKVIVNEVTRVMMLRSKTTGTISIEVRDIYLTSAFKVALIHDEIEGAASCSLEMVWDTTNAHQTTEVVSVSWRNSEATLEFGSQITWRSRDTDAVSGKITNSNGQLQVAVSVLHNKVRDWGLDISSQSEYRGQDKLDHTKKLTIVVPSHAIEYDYHLSDKADVSHCDASLKWSQRDGPKHGLEYVYDVQTLNNGDLSHTLVVRQIGRQVQTFSSRYQMGSETKSVSVDINHSHDLTRRINLEASFGANSNAKTTTVNVRSSYTFGAMPSQRNGLTVSVDEEQFLMEFLDNSNIYTCLGKVTHQGIRKVTLAFNGQEFAQLFVRLDEDKPQLKAELGFAQKDWRFSAGLKESNIISLNIESQRDGEAAVVELDTSLVLSEDGRVLKVEFDWRPELVTEARQALGVAHYGVLAASQKALPHVLTHAALLQRIVQTTIKETAEHIKETLDVDISQYLFVYETLMSNIQSLHINSIPIVKIVVTHTTKMLTIWVKEMTNVAQKVMVAGKAFVEMTQVVVNDAVRFVFDHFQGTWEFITEIKLAIIDELAQLEVGDFNARDYIKVAVNLVRLTLEKVTVVYKEWHEYLALLPASVSSEFDADVARFLNDVSRFLKKFKTFNKVLAVYWDYQSWFEEFHLSQRVEHVTSDLKSHLVDIGRQLSQLKASLMEYWNTTVGKINGTLSDYPLLAYGVSVGKKVLHVTKKLIDQMSVEHNLKTWVRKIIGCADAVASSLVRLIDVFYHEEDLMSYEFNYDLSAGSIVYKQVMPFQWYGFLDTPDIFKVAGLVGIGQPLAEEIYPDLKALQHDILEVIDVVSAALHTKSVIPPFSATALVAGDSHIITFDRTYYNFAGSQGCSYLLTSDFSNGRFSAIANYDTDMRRTSIDVVTDGHTVNIDTTPAVDGLIKVTLDNRNTQLPIQFDHTYVYREENTIVVENSEGLRTSCNTVYNVCTFTISGWYFGKTGGLLGIYDNEPSNDWMTSDRQIVETLEDFVNSWSVTHDKQCPVRFFSNSPAQATLEEAEACESVFSSTSALMPCFSTVDPAPYKSMCLRDMQAMKNRADKRSGTCSSAAAYIKQCQQAGVELWMPGHCVRCEINRQETMANGESTRIQGNSPQSADVVFIVQQSSCLGDLELQNLPQLVDKSLTNKGLTDNRYALVSFAGSNQLQRPHIVTAASKIFNDVSHMKTALDHLKTINDGSGEAGDIYEALQFSARLNLRAGVVKTFVLVRCDTSESLTSRAYGDSMTMLLEQGISMHVMMPLEMRLKGSMATKLTSKMYGFSKDAVITASTLDKDLRRQLKDPKDQVSTLAQESGGAVFDLNRLKSRKRNLAKKATTMMGKALADLSQPLDCEVCDCLADADGKGRVMCHRCVLPSIDIVLQNLEMMLKQ